MGTGLLLREDVRKYGSVMDGREETKGMNNLCGAVDALLGGRAKVAGQFVKECSCISNLQGMTLSSSLLPDNGNVCILI